MKLTNGEIFNAKEPLARLMEAKPPFKISYDLAMLASKLNSQFEVINQVRQGLFQTYGTPDLKNPAQMMVLPITEQRDDEGNVVNGDDDNPIMIPNPKQPKFLAEQEELMAQEVEVILEVVEIPSGLELGVEPAVLLPLLKFIKMV